MIELVLASNNKKKIAELGTLLASAASNGISVISLRDIGFDGDIVEDGASFEENALIKALTPASRGYIGIADDSGLCVDALGGAPGIYSARYSGEDANDEKNRQKLLDALRDVPEERRTAHFVCTAALVLPECSHFEIPEAWRIPDELAARRGLDPCRAMVVRGECEGRILSRERGDGGFGYDPLFWYPAFDATFAEIPGEQKNLVSHRGRAMRAFTDRLAAILKE
ncbi:MAG: non-canonical purine NTP pyrophosphatase [Clostridia bacterium]|nr:non-canonical purine NTP pyrophosphatase [Clostridia bacterium]